MSLPCTGIGSTRKLILGIMAGITGLGLISGLTVIHLASSVLLIMHNLFEFLGIIFGLLTFFIAWFGARNNNSIQITIVSLVALCTSVLDMAHIVSHPSMPGTDFIGNSSLYVVFWIFSRFVWSFGLLYAMSSPSYGKLCYFSHKTALYLSLLACLALIFNILFNNEFWTGIFHDQSLVIYAQSIATIAGLAALFILRRQCPNHASGVFFQSAIMLGILTDLCSAFSPHTSLSINISAHLCKITANYYLLRALFVSVVKQPYDEMIQLKEDMEALAANNAKLYEQSEQQRNLIEDTIAKLGLIISSQLNLKDTFAAIADMVADMMQARQSLIALLHKDQSVFQVVATYGINTPPETMPLSGSLAGQVLERRAALFIEDLSLHPDIFRPQLIFSSIRSIICAPLVKDGQIIGVIEAYSSERAAFNKHNALLLNALGYHAAAAISSAQLFEETKKRLTEEKFLYLLTHSATSTIDPDNIMKQCTAYTVEALNADVGLGLLSIDDKQSMLVKSIIGLDCNLNYIDLNEYPRLKEIVAQEKPATVPPDAFPALLDCCCGQSAQCSLMVMPLVVEHRLIGMIILGWQRAIHPERFERISFAALMAQQIALGLEKAHLYNQVKAMALSDGLTGLANRRNFDMFLKAELRRATSLKRPLSLIMFDLDKFKNYNDTYGHLTGDKLLTQIGQILHHNVRSIDFPARYGGEEFSIILPECSNSEAVTIAEKIRQVVESTLFPDNMDQFTARITASLGVTTYEPLLTPVPPTMEKIITVADKALYQAKQEGRNRVVNATILE